MGKTWGKPGGTGAARAAYPHSQPIHTVDFLPASRWGNPLPPPLLSENGENLFHFSQGKAWGESAHPTAASKFDRFPKK